MSIYKLELNGDKLKCIDILPEMPINKDVRYIYATETELNKLNKKIIDFSNVSLDTSFLDL